MAALDTKILRDDFPVFRKTMNGKPLVYLDTASSAQKPAAVIESMNAVMTGHYANIHRGLYEFSQRTTSSYEAVRGKAARFINAFSEDEIVFTRNTTEAINLVAQSWGRAQLRAGDEILLTGMEHHANIVPWQMIAAERGAVIKVVPVLDNGTLDQDAFAKLVTPRTKMLALVHVSNALGTVNPAAELIKTAKSINPALVALVDGSQSAVHGPVDVRTLGCDFFACTGHKLYGPSGTGFLWGRYELLQSMPPYQGGGDMIEQVSFEGTTYKPAPARFEAGTPAIVEVIGLGAALDYLTGIGMAAIHAQEQALKDYALPALAAVPGLTFYGAGVQKAGIFSFTASWGHPSDISMILDQQGIAVRAGHHCCQPLMKRLGVEGTIRASLGLYSTRADIDALVKGLEKARSLLS